MSERDSSVWRPKLAAIGSFLLLLAGTAQAQVGTGFQQVGDVCSAVLSNGLRDNFSVLSESARYSQFQSILCNANYENYESFSSGSSSLGLTIPLAESLIGLDGSLESKRSNFNERYSAFCASTHSDDQFQQRFVRDESRINAALHTTWLECHRTHVQMYTRLHEKGIYVSIVPQENFSDLSVHVTRTSPRGGDLEILDVSPSSDLRCMRAGVEFGTGSVVSEREFEFQCTKPAHRAIALTLTTDEGISNTVVAPSEESRISELNDRLLRANSQVSRLETELSRIKQLVESTQIELSGVNRFISRVGQPRNCEWIQVDVPSTTYCPEGKYATGLNQEYDGGRGSFRVWTHEMQCCNLAP